MLTLYKFHSTTTQSYICIRSNLEVKELRQRSDSHQPFQISSRGCPSAVHCRVLFRVCLTLGFRPQGAAEVLVRDDRSLRAYTMWSEVHWHLTVVWITVDRLLSSCLDNYLLVSVVLCLPSALDIFAAVERLDFGITCSY